MIPPSADKTRVLIDGYDVMFAQGLPGKLTGPDGFREARLPFLDTLADGLSSFDAARTTVVFDAASRSDDLPPQSAHRRMTIVFAVDEGSADVRIKRLIAESSAPEALTVVSSDSQIRRAAARRRATVFSADEFLNRLESRRRVPPAVSPDPEKPSVRELPRGEACFWLDPPRYLEERPGTPSASDRDVGIPGDAEIAQFQRAVEEGFGVVEAKEE